MWTPTLLTTTLFALVTGVCHNYQDYYEELGCTPALVGDDGCPKSYKCNDVAARDATKCYYKGKSYTADQKLQGLNDHCVVECRCSSRFSSKLAFDCVHTECPELFNGPPHPGCYRVYNHDHCCSVDEICDQTQGQKAARAVCQYKSETYQVGQRFYPEEEPCLGCICQSGFNGSLVEPFCKKIQCNIELNYGDKIAEGCSPVFYGDERCCPIGWRCPEKSDTVIVSPTTKTDSKNPELQCKFGDLQLGLGSSLSPSRQWSDTTCTCTVPPHVICTQKH